jgi:FMN-dependent NADH-azoreductase
MPTLLHIDSSPLGEASLSRHLSAEFVRNWTQAHPDGNVITRDLTTSGLTAITAEWIGASFTPPASRTEAQHTVLAISEALIAELRSADEYVFGLPMHNFTVPATLRLWIDQVVRAGETFSYTATGPVGLLTDKKATFVIASGGVYGPGTAMASLNFVEPYLRTLFGFIGIQDTHFLTAGGAADIMSGKIDREVFLQTHVEAIRAGFPNA